MVSIEDSRISKEGNLFIAKCVCGITLPFTSKNSALNMLNRGSCRKCAKNYRNVGDHNYEIFKFENKWGTFCSGCGGEQLYTRKDHAKQSYLMDWQCRNCAAKSKSYSNNAPIGDRKRVYNKFYKSSKDRRISWELNDETMFANFTGFCALTGWPISLSYGKQTASLDRIDSSMGYTEGNIQWVHTMVNMSKNKYTQKDFIDMCIAVSKLQCTEVNILDKINNK